MKISQLLSDETQLFVEQNYLKDINQLSLKYSSKFEDWISITHQLIGKKKSIEKLPTWFRTKNIVYPKTISIEQSSSEATAKYKANIVSGESLIDLTGGFGVDDFYFSKKIKSVIHCEINPDLSEIVSHNSNVLHANSMQHYTGDSIEYLKKSTEVFDWIYIDPARRDHAKNKVFFLEDCIPNVIENQNLFFKKTSNLLIKTSPLLDITLGLKKLKNVKCIHIVAINNEVKELLWELNIDYNESPSIKTTNINKESISTIQFEYNPTLQVAQNYAPPISYLYEPNASIMKSGCFEQIGIKFDVQKIHKHSHLYTNENLIDFPGRKFKIIAVHPYKKKTIKAHLYNKKLNISTRNFPESVNQLKSKWKINDGGTLYCFFTTNCNDEKIVIFGNRTT